MQEHQQQIERRRPITLRLPVAVWEALEREAKRDRRPPASLGLILIEDGLEQRQQTAA
jgi:hypothetical protein